MKGKKIPDKEKKPLSSDSLNRDSLEQEIQQQIEQNREINKALEKLLKSVTEEQSLKKDN
jgi:hypothetical protein